MTTTNQVLKKVAGEGYKYGFVTDIESDTAPPGLNEDTVRFISEKKNDPDWMLEWRLKAFRYFMTLVDKSETPKWANIQHPPIDFQKIVYYAAPKSKEKLGSLDEVDPEILKTYEKLGISLNEQKLLAGVAVDAVFDSVSITTTFKKELGKKGIIFCSMSDAIQEHPDYCLPQRREYRHLLKIWKHHAVLIALIPDHDSQPRAR